MNHATCPECGRTVRVRTDDRIIRHWPTDREQRARMAGEPQCSGSDLLTRRWPAGSDGIRYKRPPRT